ncbi:hypothetical protein BST97_07985 [Nonlabens spongiae]|uniref:Helix-turn-helix domain-containing protein n=1 Tax=Nonlabens spongiae TaxID=331648 RepID=A0A1W6MK09_9FLAO|nr:helix-turn-helix domain-containing protein [Nonlabens spongiae]ARN77941.1 hypothetical protein BST97_07985 [Nonlabens spongiae]
MHLEVIITDDLENFKKEIIQSVSQLFNNQQQPTQWLKSAQVREMLSISAGTLQNYREKGRLPYTRIGDTIFYDRNDIERILNQNKVGS